MSGICAVWHYDRCVRTTEAVSVIASGFRLADENIVQQTDGAVGVAVCARFATQQMFSNEQVMVACDADLYNQEELASVVSKAIPTTKNTTGALLAALYMRLGAGFVEKLRGSFSVVLWDRRNRSMLAAVDRFGIGRLAYHESSKLLAVASRVDSLVQCGDIDRQINPRAIPRIVNFTANVSPETIFSGIYRLPPGHLLLASEARVRLQKYWDMRYGVGEDSDEDRLARGLESAVEESVSVQCKSTTGCRVGAFLSGGTDSSTVVGMMTRVGKAPVKAFSIGFAEQSFNELEYAQIAAKKFGADLHTHIVTAADCYGVLPQIVQAFDEPYGNSSAVATYFCARLAHDNGVDVLLAGDGGDELFGGNEWYRTDQIFARYERIPSVLRKYAVEPALNYFPFENSFIRRARGYVRRANMPDGERVLSYQFLSTHPAETVFAPDLLRSLNGYSFLEEPRRYYKQADARHHLDRLLYTDLKITIGYNDLPKVTATSEIAGVKPRFPFLDHSVAEFSGHIPASLKVKGLQKRYLFKRAFRELLPAEIITKTKHGFGIPVADWLKSDPKMRELSHDTLLSKRASGRGYFRKGFIEDLLRKHDNDETSYYGDTVWTLLAMELWHLQVADRTAAVGA